jgi:hypothetical protein
LACPPRPLIWLLVQAKWAARVAARYSDLVDAERLDKFLFGAQRIKAAAHPRASGRR